MNQKQLARFESILEDPTNVQVKWTEAITLLKAAGAVVGTKEERVRVSLNNTRAILHRPEAAVDLNAGSVFALRRLLLSGGDQEA